MIFGYCRISTDRQNIERQIRNIQKAYPDAIIKQEVYTGTKTDGRKVLNSFWKSLNQAIRLFLTAYREWAVMLKLAFRYIRSCMTKVLSLFFWKSRISILKLTKRLCRIISLWPEQKQILSWKLSMSILWSLPKNRLL